MAARGGGPDIYRFRVERFAPEHERWLQAVVVEAFDGRFAVYADDSGYGSTVWWVVVATPSPAGGKLAEVLPWRWVAAYLSSPNACVNFVELERRARTIRAPLGGGTEMYAADEETLAIARSRAAEPVSPTLVESTEDAASRIIQRTVAALAGRREPMPTRGPGPVRRRQRA